MASAIRPARVLALAKRTLSCPTAPFREGEVIAWLREFAAASPQLRLHEDRAGNVELRRRGVRASPSPLVFGAHMDHPGFRGLHCKRVGREYRIEALFLGGVRPSYFAGSRARFFSDDGEIPARVLRTRPDKKTGEQRVNLSARKPVPAGAYGMWDLPAFRRKGNLIESRAVDDLAGVAATLALLDRIDQIDPRRRVDVRGLFTRGEEVGFVGALAVARGRRLPKASRIIAVEASKALPSAPQGAGPILRVGDRTSIFDDGLTRWIDRVGLKLGKRFAYQRKLMDGGTCESTAYQLFGYRCSGLCLPLGNYHNMSERGRIAAETIHVADLVGLVRFFEAMVRHDREAPRLGAPDPLRARLNRSFERRKRDLKRSPFA